MEKSRILLVDDDEVFRETLASFLRKTGHECVCAPDVTTARQLLEASDFDLLISDLSMPGNWGPAFIRQMSGLAPGLPVILLTAHPTMESAAQSLQLPVAAYLVKPANLDELLAVARKAIDRYRTYRTVSANRQRLQNWLRDVTQIEELLASSAQGPSAAPEEDYLALTFQNLLLSFADLKHVIQAVGRAEGADEGPVWPYRGAAENH